MHSRPTETAIVVADLDRDRAPETIQGVIDAGGKAIGVRADVRNEADIATCVAHAEAASRF